MDDLPSLEVENREPVRDEREVPNKIDLPFVYASIDFISVLTKLEISWDPNVPSINFVESIDLGQNSNTVARWGRFRSSRSHV